MHNLTSHGWADCGSISTDFPALPPPDGPCYYSPPVVTSGVVIMLAALLLTVWSWWQLAGLALQPLSVTAETVRRLGPQNLGQRIRLGGAADGFKEPRRRARTCERWALSCCAPTSATRA
jgi:hypothetical protein